MFLIIGEYLNDLFLLDKRLNCLLFFIVVITVVSIFLCRISLLVSSELKLSMWIPLLITLGYINRDKVSSLFKNDSYVVNNNLSIFISLQ